ncbi:hypothetical protein T484DRAFT_1885743 [Baffinella frigidus]|nr:hypothetical protein T484DRAFT_1885743 [Cryptophyta sp. CCMP2293]|mmetsp:Transcript_36164/g.85618  ORF Transcript_36164/g.85618 Transcript_36164/m.85618 type:complete len:94 (+) Transcript_36164:61-342(+)
METVPDDESLICDEGSAASGAVDILPLDLNYIGNLYAAGFLLLVLLLALNYITWRHYDETIYAVLSEFSSSRSREAADGGSSSMTEKAGRERD